MSLRAVLVCIGLACIGATDAAAQGGGVVVINPERLFGETLYGQRLQSEFEAAARRLAAENREIESTLLAEEKDLTERRASMERTEFRVLADAFDEKVERIRSEQDRKSEDLRAMQERQQQGFLAAVQPILGGILRESGAAVMLDRRGVFLSVQGVDVTDRAITRIDAALGEGRETASPGASGGTAGTDGAGQAELPSTTLPGPMSGPETEGPLPAPPQ